MFRLFLVSLCLMGCATTARVENRSALVITTDFGLKDGAVSEMKGVAFEVSPQLLVSDLTHEVPPYNIWEASYRLQQTYAYWPKGTVFVTVVDPGVGSERRSVAVRTKSGHYFVGPDNGHLTRIADLAGVESVRVINEAQQRRKGSEASYTFHGRDLYVYVGARLASGQTRFEDLGPESQEPLVKIRYQHAEFSDGALRGSLPVLDPNYGNVWSDIPQNLVNQHFPGAKELRVRLFRRNQKMYEAKLPLVNTFASVKPGQPLLYFNSLLNLSLALNMENFSKRHRIEAGPDWSVSVSAP